MTHPQYFGAFFIQSRHRRTIRTVRGSVTSRHAIWSHTFTVLCNGCSRLDSRRIGTSSHNALRCNYIISFVYHVINSFRCWFCGDRVTNGGAIFQEKACLPPLRWPSGTGDGAFGWFSMYQVKLVLRRINFLRKVALRRLFVFWKAGKFTISRKIVDHPLLIRRWYLGEWNFVFCKLRAMS